MNRYKHPTVASLMSAPVIAVGEMTGVKEIAGILTKRGFNGVPVQDRLGRLVGIITEDDLVARQDPRTHRRPHLWSDPNGTDRQRAEGRVARQIMSPRPLAIEADASVEQAAEVLHEHHLKSLPVIDADGELVGMITRRDLLRLFYTREDAGIAAEIARRFHDRCVDMDHLEFRVQDGVVTVDGVVDQVSEVEALRRLAQDVDGVVTVRMWVAVDPR